MKLITSHDARLYALQIHKGLLKLKEIRVFLVILKYQVFLSALNSSCLNSTTFEREPAIMPRFTVLKATYIVGVLRKHNPLCYGLKP